MNQQKKEITEEKFYRDERQPGAGIDPAREAAEEMPVTREKPIKQTAETAAEEPATTKSEAVKPAVEPEAGEDLEQRDEQEIAKHEAALEKVAEEFREAQADFEKSREEILRALANPVLEDQIREEKQEIKKLLKPGLMKTVANGISKFLFREKGQDPARRALVELDRRKKELEDKLDKIDLVSEVLLKKAVATPDLSYLESKKRLEIRSRARFYGKKQTELLKNVGDFRKEVRLFCGNQKVIAAQKFLPQDEREEMSRYMHGLK